MSKRRSGRAGGRQPGAPPARPDFWGKPRPEAEVVEPPRIRPTPEPAALPRSLGDPPLAASTMAQHHLAAVYEEAVRAAVALAGANGLLDIER